MTFNERTYLALCPPLIIPIIFDGEGVLDPKLWQAAVASASEVNPGARLLLKGHLNRSRWVDSGITPRVREVDGGKWDGHGPEGAPQCLQESLPFREGPTCEVILIQGPTPRVVFRAHHSVMDGRGVMFWAEDIFRVLRGEKAIGATSNITDVELCKTFQNHFRPPFSNEHIAPTGLPEGDAQGSTWKRRKITGTVPQILARCARLTAEEAWRHSEGIVRFGIPVDMRTHEPALRSTANLTLDIYIEVRHDTTPEQIADDIKFQLNKGYEGRLTKTDELLEYVPLCLLRYAAKNIIRKRHQKGKYRLSGMLTNLGRFDLSLLQGGGFSARALWGIPPGNEYFPFFLGIIGYDGASELILSVPKKLASHNRLDDTLERIASGLEKK